MFALAVPVVIAELGWMTMGMVDTLMVGPARPGSDRRGRHRQLAVHRRRASSRWGCCSASITLVSQAFGAGRLDECHRWLVHGVVPRACCLAVPIDVARLRACRRRSVAGDSIRRCCALTRPYLDVLAWSIPPLLLYCAFRRYLQGMGVVRPVMIALVAANIVNVVVNWILIYGRLGAPALGVRGSAWATVVARVVDGGVLLVVIVLPRARVEPAADSSTTPLAARAGRGCAGCSSLGLPGREAGDARSRRLRRRDRAGRTAARRLRSRRTRSRSTSRRSPSWCRSASRRRARCASAMRSGRGDPAGAARCRLDGACSSASLFMSCAAAGVPADPARADRRVHARRRRARRSACRCCSSPRSFSCSTACRASRPACCAASATPGRRCCGTSPATGSSACRSATRSASARLRRRSACGGGCRRA